MVHQLTHNLPICLSFTGSRLSNSINVGQICLDYRLLLLFSARRLAAAATLYVSIHEYELPMWSTPEKDRDG